MQLIINVHHQKTLNDYVVVSDLDNNYIKYMNNVTKIEEMVGSIGNSSEFYLPFSNVTSILKKDGVFRLIPNKELKYLDLYNLNNYFIEELINNGWIQNIKNLSSSKKYFSEVDFLISNANYMNNN